jgi:DNA-binding MarR family transcriptional regulator
MRRRLPSYLLSQIGSLGPVDLIIEGSGTACRQPRSRSLAVMGRAAPKSSSRPASGADGALLRREPARSARSPARLVQLFEELFFFLGTLAPGLPSLGAPRLPLPPVRDEEYEQLAAFRYALRRFLSFSEQAARQAGVTPQQYLALLAVRGFPGRRQVTISELAERLKIRHHSAVGLVNRLVSQGLMVRTPNTDDRRQVFAALTPRGAELLDRLAAAHRDQLRRIEPELTAALERLAHSGG